MTGRIVIDGDIISAHAARVDRVSADIALARQAASATNMGAGAFGLVCAFLVPPATLATSMAQRAISSSEAMVRRSATEVRGVARDMEAFEDQAVATIDRLGADLG